MKNWIYTLIIGLVGSLVSSCQQSLDEEVQLPARSGKAEITFTIALDNIGSRSRASWEDNETAGDSSVGNEFDNQIDLTSANGFQVLAYNTNGDFLGEVTNKEIRKVSVNEYKFNGQLTVNNLSSETLECHLMVYANCINSKETFSYNTQYIPMWGVKQTTLHLTKGELTNLKEPIYLLRTMAKVEVKLSDEIADKFEMSSVMVDRYNTMGNVLPNYSILTDTEKLNQNTVFNPNNTTTGSNLHFTQVTGEESFYIYLPEYDNTSEGTVPATMKVMIDGTEFTLDFKNYQTNTPFNVVRNHYYQYIITSVNTVENVLVADILYQSMPWKDVDNGNLTFGNGNGDTQF